MKIRMKFTKTGVMKFVGHLDLLRVFQKTFRRASVPMAYSQGFNPHQLISIGAPLPIGVTSEGEYIDIVIKEKLEKEKAIHMINEVVPSGLRITDWLELEDDAKTSMAIIEAGTYSIQPNMWELSVEDTKKAIEAFMSQEEILIMKESKKKRREVNIKEGILMLNFTDDKEFKMFLATGSKLNTKPDLVLEAFSKFINKEFKPFEYRIHRNELYAFAEGSFKPLDQL
ncbi:radical SAM-linked protein [Natranaerovirga pectinivora]|uniref:Radical SAM-linked protein n=1 Tax=Natranaerovirga pectinivora TaxID=682400 RepID=A0A4R3MPL9_9FIRM|nr:TIGR03936 family radical SAM-associated protein [Natranaerovirga pectinivora]TCT14922.1 radical SAM-linked protein [Natranaerovirga pectinivora]